MSANAGTIVVAYDGSPDAEAALYWAAETAAMSENLVRAVIVDDDTDHPGRLGEWESDDMRAAQVDAVLTAAGANGAAQRFEGDVANIVLQQANGADMLVLGSRGHGRAVEILGGSVSRHLVETAPCPVVVVRTVANSDANRIVVGVDGSAESIAALQFACSRAEGTDESVVALYAWKAGRMRLDSHGHLDGDIAARSVTAAGALDEYVAGAREDHPTVAIQPDVLPMAPGPALTEASASASLIVTGSHRRGALGGLLHGSVSRHVLHHAHCPVAVVR